MVTLSKASGGSAFDCIVLGTGGVGSAALYHLARRGAWVLGIDRFEPGHDRGSSHGDTRIIRQAYFEHSDYVPLLLRAYELWEELSRLSGLQLYREVGLLQVGPPGGVVVPGVVGAARRHDLPVEELTAAEAEARFPGFRVPHGLAAVFERRAGFLRVEECVRTHLEEAVRLGARLSTGETIRGWRREGSGFVVQTDRAEHRSGRLIVTSGAWARDLLGDLGLRLQVRRKPLLWYRTESPAYRADRGAPCFLHETPAGIFYGFPEIDRFGLKVAEHTGGEEVADPLSPDRSLRDADRAPVEAFLQAHLPAVGREVLKHVICMYTMTPDEHFVIDRHPSHPQLAFAAGLSGHGFKFTSVLGEILTQLVLDGKTPLPIGFLSVSRPGLR
jgi:sarcosine oxidase